MVELTREEKAEEKSIPLRSLAKKFNSMAGGGLGRGVVSKKRFDGTTPTFRSRQKHAAGFMMGGQGFQSVGMVDEISGNCHAPKSQRRDGLPGLSSIGCRKRRGKQTEKNIDHNCRGVHQGTNIKKRVA